MTDEKKFISITEFIEKAKQLGINLGHGNAMHRIRYYIKSGLLPHQVRVKESDDQGATSGHLPSYALYLLQKIEELKAEGKSSEEIKAIMAKERLTFEAEEIGHEVKSPLSDLFSKMLTFATLLLLVIAIYALPGKVNNQQEKNTEPISQDVLANTKAIFVDTPNGQLSSGNIIVITRPQNGQSIQLQGTDGKKVIPLSSDLTIDASGNITPPTNENKPTQTTVGSSSLAKGQARIDVEARLITKNSKVFLTPRAKLGGQSLIVTQIKEGTSFVVELEKPLDHAVSFDWMIVN